MGLYCCSFIIDNCTADSFEDILHYIKDSDTLAADIDNPDCMAN